MNGFDRVVGHRNIVGALRVRVDEGKHPPVMFLGPPAAGKMTLARTYARAVLCEAVSRPCDECDACVAVPNHSLRYIELPAKTYNSHELVRDQLRKLRGIGNEYVVLVVRDVEALPLDVSDRLLNPLESDEWAKSHLSVVAFTSSNRGSVNPAILSRCDVYELRPLSIDEVVTDLEARCRTKDIRYEPAGLRVLAIASRGWVGRARVFLNELKDGAPLTVTDALEIAGHGCGHHVIACWRAALGGRLDEAREHSRKIGGDVGRRAGAMLAFLEVILRRRLGHRQSGSGNLLPVYEVKEETWQAVETEWDQFARWRGRPLLDCVREMIEFWSRVPGLPHWDLVFGRFTFLLGHR